MERRKRDAAAPPAEDPLEPKAERLARQLSAIMSTAHSSQQTSLSVAIGRLASINPEDPIEEMLVVQMIGTHEAATECLRRAMLPEQSIDARDLNLKHGARLMGIFERQVGALDRRRGRGQQNVTVKYVHVAEGGQAIVGNVSRNGTAAVQEALAPPALQAPRVLPHEIPRARTKVRIK